MPSIGGVPYIQDLAQVVISPIAEASFGDTRNFFNGALQEDTLITLPTATYAAGYAYEAILEGAFYMSVSSYIPTFNLRKESLSGTHIANFGDRIQPAGTTSATGFYLSAMFKVTNVAVAASLIATITPLTGTASVTGFGGRPGRLRIYRRGASSAYTNLPDLS